MSVAAVAEAPPCTAPVALSIDENGLGLITLNRPRELNAWSPALMEELARVLRSLPAAGVRVVVTRGEGRSFSAGGDIGMFATPPSGAERERVAQALGSIYRSLLEDGVVHVAAIHGHCVGSALVYASCCDFRVCDETARFLLPEVGMGMLPGIGVGWIGRTMPDGLLRRLLLTGEPVGATDPACADYVTLRTPPGQAHAQALSLARRLLDKPAEALRLCKELANRLRGPVDALFIAHERLLNERLLDGDEVQARARAFLAARSAPR